MQKSSLNRVILIGRVGQNPELKFTTRGTAVCNLSMVTNEIFKDKEEKAEWHNIVIWGESGERAAEWIEKGQLINIEGRIQTQSWENDQKEKRYKTVIIADNWTTLTSKKNKEEPLKQNDDGEELPF